MASDRIRPEAWALAGLLLASGAAGCGDTGGATGSSRPPVAVEITTVAPERLVDVISFIGQLDADESVMLRPETSGIIDSIEFEEGQEVQAGAVLFRLRDAEQRARFQAADAGLELAARNHERAAQLRRDGVLSVEEFDRSFAEKRRAGAALEVAKVALDRTVIRAPFDGVAGHRYVSPGDHVRGGGGTGNAGTGLVQIDAIDSLKLLFSLPERAIAQVRLGMSLGVEVAPLPGKMFRGEVFFVAPSVDPANRRLLIKARVPNDEHLLQPGLSATVHLELGDRPEALSVPEAALVYDAGGSFVWRVMEDETVARVAVEIGTRQDGLAEIVSGLSAGDRVVSAGTNKVAPGRMVQDARVHARDAAEPSRAGS